MVSGPAAPLVFILKSAVFTSLMVIGLLGLHYPHTPLEGPGRLPGQTGC